jgi:hypothetical protein
LCAVALFAALGAVAQPATQPAAPSAPQPAAAAARTCSLGSFGITTDASLSSAQVCAVNDDLLYLSAMSFSSIGPGFSAMFSCTDAAHGGRCLADWLRPRLTRLSFRAVGGMDAANLGHAARIGEPGVPPTTPVGSVVLATSYFGLSRIARLATLIHEARHTDGDRNVSWLQAHHLDSEPNHPSTNHVSARNVVLADAGSTAVASEAGPDDSFEDGGGYAYMLVFVDNVANCSSCASADTDRASLDVLQRTITNRFRQPSLTILTPATRPQ